MKRFLLVAMILASAASLYAAELKITGDAEVRGVMDQVDRGDTEIYANSYFDADFNFNAALVLTENTTVFTRLTFDSEADYVGPAGVDKVEDQMAVDGGNDDHTYLGVERAYISTKFLPALTVDAGLMGGGMWGTAFGNNESNIVRIKGTYAIDENMSVIAIYEKNTESETDPSAVQNNLSDFGDRTTYYLAANLKFGQFTVLPLVKYVDMKDASTAALDNNPYAYAIDLAVTGDMGMVGFEFEAVYESTDGDGDDTLDETKYGVYVDVFAKLDPAKIGLAAFYAGATEDGVYNPGEDFDFLLIAGEMLSCYYYNPFPATQSMNLAGKTAFKLYADAKVMEKVEAGAAFAYGMTNDKEEAGDVTFWEVDADVAYLIDANTKWTLEAGYVSWDDGGSDPLTSYRVQQKISVKF